MPRDAAQHALGEVPVSGGRRGRVIETIVAGEYAVEVVGADWIGRLGGAGLLDRSQVEAAQTVALLFEQSGLRPHIASSFGCVVDFSGSEGPFERMTAPKTKAWRRLQRLLGRCPAHCRSVVEDAAIWDVRPSSVGLLREGLAAVARALGIHCR